ncbi:arginine--tRNA ligase [bacterium]|nr:arginine--tRNA ligase [bacterium]MBR6462164.1 arginine--tRNA ligase [bacterium]
MQEKIKTLLEQAREATAKAEGVEATFPPVVITVPKDTTHGNFTTNAALISSKAFKQSPAVLAGKLVEYCNANCGSDLSFEVAGPGFINIKLLGDAKSSAFMALFNSGEKIGLSDIGKGKTVDVEYVSANPTGPLTVGHGRNAAVGDVISRLFTAVGYDVTKEYYFNDAGNQMNVLARSVRCRYRQLLGSDEQLEENGYQGEYIVDIAKDVLKDFGDSLKDTDELKTFKEYAVRATFAMIKDSLKKMRVNHDVYFNEHSLYDSGRIKETLDLIAAKGLSYEKDGAVWYKASQFGAEKDRALVKSSGEPTYRLPDIAYHRDKFERGFDRIVDIFGADHIAQYPDVLSCLKALGYDVDKVTVAIYQFVTLLSNGEAVKMSTRKANYVTLDELMDDVGVDAVRYFFVMRRLGSHLEFDLALAKKQSPDNPVFYIQYAYARIASIFRKAEVTTESLAGKEIKADLLTDPSEQELIKLLGTMKDTVEKAAELCEPHRLTGYLEKLAEAFHHYYNAAQILVEDKDLCTARLALLSVVRNAIKCGLDILGISAPEKM